MAELGINVDMAMHGMEDVVKLLHALPQELVSKKGGPVSRALRKAANVIRAQAVANAPQRTGLLKKSIIVTRARRMPAGVLGERYLVWMGRIKKRYTNTRKNRRAGRAGNFYMQEGPAFYGSFLEYGTSKMRARPWLRPAVAARGADAVRAFEREITRQLEVIMRKLVQRYPGGLPRGR